METGKEKTMKGIERNTDPDIDEILDQSPISVFINDRWQTFPNAAAAEQAMHDGGNNRGEEEDIEME